MKNAFSFMLVFLPFSTFAKEPPISYMPNSNLPHYVFEKLDLTTFRNSFGPARSPGQRHFSAFGLKPTEEKGNLLTIETDDWLYEVEIIRVADVNSDGIADIEVCFRDKAKEGSYNTQKPLLLSQLEKHGQLVALKFEVDGCEAYARQSCS